MRDIAVQAGLSEATVDRVLHERPGVRAGTVEQVRRAVADLELQQSQVRLSGRTVMFDVVMSAPRRFADAVRAVARLPRASAIVLAGSLMGGDIEKAVREVRAQGLLVVSLNMAGSVPEAADLVVTDPVQAGVMTVMAIADTAKFTVERLPRRVF